MLLEPTKIANCTQDHQCLEGFTVPWRSWIRGAIPAMQETISASSRISRLADLLARSSARAATVSSLRCNHYQPVHPLFGSPPLKIDPSGPGAHGIRPRPPPGAPGGFDMQKIRLEGVSNKRICCVCMLVIFFDVVY